MSIVTLLFMLTPAAGQTGLYSYKGGYFLRNGSHWEEYRPDSKIGVWATYEQYNEESNFFNIKNSNCSVSVPKNTSGNFFYALPGGEWSEIYTTSEIYDYMPSDARDIYIVTRADISSGTAWIGMNIVRATNMMCGILTSR